MIPYNATFFYSLSVPKNAYQSRLSRLQAQMRKRKIRALLVTHPTNIRYLTGLSVSAGAIVVEQSSVSLFLDGRYSESGKRVEWMELRSLTDLSRQIRNYRRLHFEESHVTVAALDRWTRTYKSTKFVHSKDLLEGLRQKKDLSEIRSIRRAIARTRSILRRIPSWLRPGITERALARRIEDEALRLGAELMAFDTIVGFGEHTSRPHHHPTDRALRKGDIVQIDLGLKIDGYCSDMSRVFYTGTKTSRQAKAYRALLEAKKTAEKMVKPGVDVRALDQAARRVLKKHGFGKEFCHALGHGLGLDIHEAPTISGKSKPYRLKKDEVITIEPGLYFPGEWGMRIEDTMIVR